MIKSENILRPSVTVVMAAYNSELHISRSIESVQSQTLRDWELICIDDGSTDRTSEIIHSFAKDDSRIMLISQQNKGPAMARQKGYLAGNGEYYILLDSDDWLDSKALAEMYNVAIQADVDAVMCHWLNPSDITNEWDSFYIRHGFSEGDLLTGKQAFGFTFPWRLHGACLFRSQVIKLTASQTTEELNSYNSDEFVTRRMFLNCQDILMGPGKYYRPRNPNSLTRKLSWRSYLSLDTDRLLTDLAVENLVEPDVLESILEKQRNNIFNQILRLASHGAEGKEKVVFIEIYKSIVHYCDAVSKPGVFAFPSFVLGFSVFILKTMGNRVIIAFQHDKHFKLHC